MQCKSWPAVLLLLWIPAASAAPAPLAAAQVDLTGDGAAEAVEVREDAVRVSRNGVALGEIALAPRLVEARIERKMDAERPVLWVEGRSGAGKSLLLLALRDGKLEALYQGPIGPVGRDGERAIAVEVGHNGIMRYQTAPGVTRCDGDGRLFAEEYAEQYDHPAWRPLVPPPPAHSISVRPTTSPPAGLGAAPLPVYHFVAASSQAGIEARADQLTPPRELEDGRPDTAWRVAGDPRGAWVTSRAEGKGRSIVALQVVPASQRGGSPHAPRTLAAVFADGTSVVFDLLPGRRPQWIKLPHPVESPCVSLVVVAAAADPGDTGLGEVGVYSDLDGQGPAGLARLTAGEDFVAGEGAARALLLLAATRPAEVLAACGEALTGATPPGRRRLHKLLIALAGPGAAKGDGKLRGAVVSLLLRALAGAPTDEQPHLWTALTAAGDAADGPLLAMAADATQPQALRAEALTRLGGRTDPRLVQALVDMDSAAQPPALRRGIVAGLGAALRCLPPDAPRGRPVREALLTLWESEAPDLQREADLVEALALGAAGCADPGPALRATAILVRSLAHRQPAPTSDAALLLGSDARRPPGPGDDFLLRYRVLQGLAQLAVATPDSTALISDTLLHSPEPVLRRAAARAAAALTGPASGELARRGLADSDTGVRLAALGALGKRQDAATVLAIEQALGGDNWPQVRRAAAEARAVICLPVPALVSSPALAPSPAQAAPAPVASLRRALHDRDSEVRRRALSGLARCEGPGAAPLLAQTAKNADAPPDLRGQACALLAGVAGPAAQPALSAALLDALQDPAADERQVALATTCARALGRVGDQQALPALSAAAAEPLSPPIRLAAVEALGQLCARAQPGDRRKLQPLLTATEKDQDPGVRTAASHAAARCRP